MMEKTRNKPTISICIPTYEMGGAGAGFLEESLEIIARQDFTDMEIVVSDHSKDDAVEKVCRGFEKKLPLRYFRNTESRGKLGPNFNNAIRNAKGKIVKMLMQDDFLVGTDSISKIVKAFSSGNVGWVVTATIHTKDGLEFFRPLYPHWNPIMHRGRNTISSPSVLAFLNDDPLMFDERLIWNTDCDYYVRLHGRYGEPAVIDTISVVNRLGEHQVSNMNTQEDLQDAEFEYMLRKHGDTKVASLILKRKLMRLGTKIKRSLRTLLKKHS